MGEETKKISFGFSKFVKKTQIVSSQINQVKPEKTNIELIDCFEDKNIKLKDPVISESKVLVIPLRRNQESASEVSQKSVSDYGASNNYPGSIHDKDGRPDCKEEETHKKDSHLASDNKSSLDSNLSSTGVSKPLTLDELAAKEILEDLKNEKTEEGSRIFSVPLTNNPPAGEKESSLEDYDSIPVSDFGMAMLRGMGWAPGKGIGKSEKLVAPALPTLRPKGMGLGADKVIKTEISSTRKAELGDLKMMKGSFVRVIAGPNKDCYGQIEGFDDEAGRLIVKLALKNIALSLNEFMVQLVDKSEFSKNSKVINVTKYEKYKDSESKMNVPPGNDSKSGKPLESHHIHPKLDKLQYNSRSQSRSPENKPKHLFDVKQSLSGTSEGSSRPKEIMKKSNKEKHKERSKSPRNKYRTFQSSSSESEFSGQKRYVSVHENKACSRKTNKTHYDSKKSRSDSRSPEERTNRSKESNTIRSSSKDKYFRESSKKKSHSAHKKRKTSRSIASFSDSSDSFREDNTYKKKKSSYKKYKSRSRSRSPRRHGKSKKHKSR